MYCAQCGKQLGKNAPPLDYHGEKYCFNCFKLITTGKLVPRLQQPPAPPVIPAISKVCPYCGKPKKVDLDHCPGCGAGFDPDEILHAPPPLTVAQAPSSAPVREIYIAAPPVDKALPSIPVNIRLEQGEFCTFTCPATWAEDRKGNRSTIFQGDFSQLKKITDGIFYITNRRVVFIGKKKSLAFLLSQIINVVPYLTALEFVINGMKDPIFLLQGNINLAHERLNASMRQG